MVGAFVDSHVHFWDPAVLTYRWLASEPSIAGVHGPAELSSEAGRQAPAQIVFVQAECDRAQALEEVAWVSRLAQGEPRIAGIVAFAPVDAGAETLRALDRLREYPLVRGVRHLIQGSTDPDFCRRPAFIEGVRALGERGLSFDLCIRHAQLPAATDLARACPHTQLILDHAGKPDIRGARLDPWRGELQELAALPHVACKLSGLVTEAGTARWAIDDLRPYAAHVLEAFGHERVLFGSDWPVVKLASTYARWVDTADKLLADLDPVARGAVFSDNARRIYRL
jgi:L-fuconolactonase